MKKNLKIEEEFLTDEMLYSFYPKTGKVIETRKFSGINETAIRRTYSNRKKQQNIGRYSINNA